MFVSQTKITIPYFKKNFLGPLLNKRTFCLPVCLCACHQKSLHVNFDKFWEIIKNNSISQAPLGEFGHMIPTLHSLLSALHAKPLFKSLLQKQNAS